MRQYHHRYECVTTPVSAYTNLNIFKWSDVDFLLTEFAPRSLLFIARTCSAVVLGYVVLNPATFVKCAAIASGSLHLQAKKFVVSSWNGCKCQKTLRADSVRKRSRCCWFSRASRKLPCLHDPHWGLLRRTVGRKRVTSTVAPLPLSIIGLVLDVVW